jgi:hypothetical protein
MTSSAPIEVKVVYDASSRGRRARAVPTSHRRSRPIALIVLGLLNLVAAGAAYYGTWWQADRFIYMKLIMHSPLPVTRTDVDRAFAEATGAPQGEVVERAATAPEGKFRGDTLFIVLGTTAYSWLTLATLAGCALALSAGALIGRAGGSAWRRIGLVLMIAVVALWAFGAIRVLMEYGMEYPPRVLRMGMSGAVAFAFALGMMIGGRTLALTRLAAVVTILLGAGTVVALQYGHRCDAIPPEQVAPVFLGLVFLSVSAWGWLLLLIGARVAR